MITRHCPCRNFSAAIATTMEKYAILLEEKAPHLSKQDILEAPRGVKPECPVFGTIFGDASDAVLLAMFLQCTQTPENVTFTRIMDNARASLVLKCSDKDFCDTLEVMEHVFGVVPNKGKVIAAAPTVSGHVGDQTLRLLEGSETLKPAFFICRADTVPRPSFRSYNEYNEYWYIFEGRKRSLPHLLIHLAPGQELHEEVTPYAVILQVKIAESVNVHWESLFKERFDLLARGTMLLRDALENTSGNPFFGKEVKEATASHGGTFFE